MASAEQLAALKAVVAAAQGARRKYGVPASVTLAQWIFESSWGTSKLSIAAKNFFGIKARQAAIPASYVEFPTTEYENGERVVVEALFEKYPDEAASFEAHARLLANAGRYHFAMLHTASPNDFAACLQTAGYSTNPHYAAELEEAMRDYDLCQYDVLPDGPAKVQEKAA
jgi:flagellum-specific peptidoglycan hydrolase FlgJ